MPEKRPGRLLGLLLCCFSFGLQASEPLRVAVAANFSPTLESIASDYQEKTGQSFIISTGSSGKLYAQIVQGAPYDLFFSADHDRPERLEKEAYIAGSRQTYALGRLVLWQADDSLPVSLEALANGSGRIAMANPRLAPYGAAAKSLLQGASLWDVVSPRLVMGENVTQAFQYASTGQVAWAFLSMSQIRLAKSLAGRVLEIEQSRHGPIRQQVVALKSGNEASALAFLEYFKTPLVRTSLVEAGYALSED